MVSSLKAQRASHSSVGSEQGGSGLGTGAPGAQSLADAQSILMTTAESTPSPWMIPNQGLGDTDDPQAMWMPGPDTVYQINRDYWSTLMQTTPDWEATQSFTFG